ncbi:MAG: exodeoxyribonuclease VII small subunit [Opitutaceae bacterium]|jgi:exodeoxyribonuclease VII small subunit|nr:exodeoxyribonuclease VII small subunit [Opitutaceae bacterium]
MKENTTEQPPAFEEAIARLEAIVEDMEGGGIPLAGLLAKYEEAAGLLKLCERQLETAEIKVGQLKAPGGARAGAE